MDGREAETPTLAVRRTARSVAAAMVLNLGIFGLEAAGGLLAGSLALVSDALHNLSDFASLALAFLAVRLALRKATDTKTYGYVRSEILVAFVNALALVAIGGWIVFEGVRRLWEPSEVRGGLVLAFGAVGLVANVLGAWLLHAHAAKDLNARAAYLHLALDAGHSLGVVAGGALISMGVPLVDPILSILIGLLILKGTWGVLAEATNILVEGAPRGLTAEDVARCLRATPGVLDVHHVHVWCLSSRRRAMSAHVVVPDQGIGASRALVERMAENLQHDCGIDHPTFQLEVAGCGPPDGPPATPAPGGAGSAGSRICHQCPQSFE